MAKRIVLLFFNKYNLELLIIILLSFPVSS